MKDLAINEMETTKGGKFWGYGDCYATGPYVYDANGNCRRWWICTYFVLWFDTGQEGHWGGCGVVTP